MANRWGKCGDSVRFHFLGLQNQCRQLTTAIKLKDACFLEESYNKHQFSSVQSLSCVRLCDPMDCSMLGFHCQLPEFTQTHVYWVSDAIQLSHSLSSSSPLAFNLFQQQGFFSKSALCIRWPKYWSFSFSIHSSNEYSGLISFRTDLLDLLAVQGTLKSLLQHHSSKASIPQHSAFFMVHSHIHTWLLEILQLTSS